MGDVPKARKTLSQFRPAEYCHGHGAGERQQQRNLVRADSPEGGSPTFSRPFISLAYVWRKLWGGFEAPPIDRFDLSRQSARQKVCARTRAGRDDPGGEGQ